jgi:hypothetical protein
MVPQSDILDGSPGQPIGSSGLVALLQLGFLVKVHHLLRNAEAAEQKCILCVADHSLDFARIFQRSLDVEGSFNAYRAACKFNLKASIDSITAK